MRRIRRIVLSVLLLTMSLASCKALENEVVASLGVYESREFYTSGGFQDFTDYAKYYFGSAEVVNNVYFTKVRERDFAELNRLLDNFESWIQIIRRDDQTSSVVVNYDFERKIIDLEDYIYVESEEHTWPDGHISLVNYNVYIFDWQTQVLYYFHNNI
ncbi:MAG: hypothetical protein IKC09_04870 [Oscillospiraceae bacterium]|nr:hypothetical protein [Oscillospiraceae bacterium]